MTGPLTPLQAAHSYARRGWSVIALHHVDAEGACWRRRGEPCIAYFDRAALRRGERIRVRSVDEHRSQAGKHPVEAKWQQHPKLSGADIEALWEAYPHANVGIATGERSGIFVFDVDPDNGGDEALRELVAAHGELPATYTVQTGSGGTHHYFTLPDFEVTISPGRLPGGLDIRGTGGQVVAPPSVTAKGAYTVLDDRDPVAAPAWLLDLIRPKAYVAPQAPAQGAVVDLPAAEATRLGAYAHSAVQRILDDLAATQVGGRDLATFSAACSLIEFANADWCELTIEQAYTLLHQHAPVGGDFLDGDVNVKWESAIRKVGDKARPMPPRPEVGAVLPVAAPTTPPAREEPSASAPATQEQPDDASPFDYFDGKKFLPLTLARTMVDDMALGHDGHVWVYRDTGVWERDDHEITRRCTEALGDEYKPGHRNAVEDIVRTWRAIRRLSADPTPELINLRNGALDWATGQLLPHHRDHLSTTQLPVEYDPDAACPNFEAWVQQMLPADCHDLIWEVIGYMLMSGNPLQKALLLYGEGGNGKGTFLRLLGHLLGRRNVTALTLKQISGDKFKVAKLYGALANIAGDIPAEYIEDTSVFKQVTGEDLITAEQKNRDPFDFVSWAVPVFSANALWRSADTTEGYFRRWMIIPFQVSTKELARGRQGLYREADLHDEAAGIVAKAIPALRRLMARGSFEVPLSMQLEKDRFVLKSDPVLTWLDEDDLVAVHDPLATRGAWTPRTRLHATYAAWCSASRHKPMSSTKFYERLAALGYVPSSHDGTRGFRGITLRGVRAVLDIDHSGETA